MFYWLGDEFTLCLFLGTFAGLLFGVFHGMAVQREEWDAIEADESSAVADLVRELEETRSALTEQGVSVIALE